MEDKKVLNDDELEKVSGGADDSDKVVGNFYKASNDDSHLYKWIYFTGTEVAPILEKYEIITIGNVKYHRNTHVTTTNYSWSQLTKYTDPINIKTDDELKKLGYIFN